MASLAGRISAASACAGADLTPPQLSVHEARQALSCLINRRRARHGRKAVIGSVTLTEAAEAHTEAMATRGFFSHEGDGTPASRAASHGYMRGAAAWGVGENLAWGSSGLASPRATVDAWMASPEHREIMLAGRFRQLGVGVVQGSPLGADAADSMTYTALFGYRRRR